MARVEPARDIRRAHRETAAGQADEQADQQEVPEMGGVLHQINRQHRAQHQTEQHNAATITVGPDTQRHPYQRAGQYRHRHQNAELGLIQPQLLLHRNAHHAHHHPGHETDGESKGTDHQHRVLLISCACHFASAAASYRPVQLHTHTILAGERKTHSPNAGNGKRKRPNGNSSFGWYSAPHKVGFAPMRVTAPATLAKIGPIANKGPSP